jgi:hypothetical protein
VFVGRLDFERSRIPVENSPIVQQPDRSRETPFHENGVPPAAIRPTCPLGSSADTSLRKSSARPGRDYLAPSQKALAGKPLVELGTGAGGNDAPQRWFRRRVALRGGERRGKREKAGLGPPVEQPEQALHNLLQESALCGGLCVGCSSCFAGNVAPGRVRRVLGLPDLFAPSFGPLPWHTSGNASREAARVAVSKAVERVRRDSAATH